MSLAQKLINQRFIEKEIKPITKTLIVTSTVDTYHCNLFTVRDWKGNGLTFSGNFNYLIRDKYNKFTKQEREPF